MSRTDTSTTDCQLVLGQLEAVVVWRWASDTVAPERGQRRQYELTEHDRRDYADWAGNVAALWRARTAAGEPVPPLRTLQRAFARELLPSERAAVVDGVEGRRRHEVYLRWEPLCRNARWEGDHGAPGAGHATARGQTGEAVDDGYREQAMQSS